jgi:hypothetical protein
VGIVIGFNDSTKLKTMKKREEPKHEPDPREPKKFPATEPNGPEPERRRVNPYPWYPAIAEGEPGKVFISYIVVYYSLN